MREQLKKEAEAVALFDEDVYALSNAEAGFLIGTLVDLIARQDAYIDGLGWQEIESAPRDGTLIDLWVPELEERYTDSKWDEKSQAFVCDFPETGQRVVFTRTLPSHWMPLPTAQNN